MTTPQDLRAAGDRIEHLLEELRATANPRAFAQAEELVRIVVDLYGAALERVTALADEQAPSVLAAMLDDELIASLLVVHGLHPEVEASEFDPSPPVETWTPVELRLAPAEVSG